MKKRYFIIFALAGLLLLAMSAQVQCPIQRIDHAGNVVSDVQGRP